MGEPQPDTIQGVVTTCTYLADAPRDSRSVFVWVNPRQTADGARTVLDNTKKDAPTLGTTAREQAGLGDGAFWIHGQLWVLKGKVVLAFAADTEANTRTLADQVLKRLP